MIPRRVIHPLGVYSSYTASEVSLLTYLILIILLVNERFKTHAIINFSIFFFALCKNNMSTLHSFWTPCIIDGNLLRWLIVSVMISYPMTDTKQNPIITIDI